MMKVFGQADPRSLEQLERCVRAEPGALGVLCADNHLGRSQPIGGAVAYRDHISVSGVGSDIACGNAAARTPILADDLRLDLPGVLDEIERRVDFGMGGKNKERPDHAVLDTIRESSFGAQRAMLDLAANQLGTVGSGNHYVDLLKDEEGFVWVGCHFGSRGFGYKTCNGFMSLAAGRKFTDDAPDVGYDDPPVLLPITSDLGQSYIQAMTVAGEYAYAGRDWVVDTVLDIMGIKRTDYVHNHHNFAWHELHGGERFWVVRKGCTPAHPFQQGFVGGSMGDMSVILEGVASATNAEGLYSTIHGAGRVMSRTKAKGKTKRRKRWECNHRDCNYGHTDRNQFACPTHPDAKPIKRWYEEVKTKGVINWPEVQAELHHRGIDLRGGGADEAPGVYKSLADVLDAHHGTIKVVHRFEPLGVVMAGADVRDPYPN